MAELPAPVTPQTIPWEDLEAFLAASAPDEGEPEKIHVAGFPLKFIRELMGHAKKAAQDVPAGVIPPPGAATPPPGAIPPVGAATPPTAPVAPGTAPVAPTPKPYSEPVPQRKQVSLEQPQAVREAITPEVAADIEQRASLQDALHRGESLGKPPDQFFNYLRTGLPDDANLFLDETAKAAGVTKPVRVTHAEVIADLKDMGYKPKDIDWIVRYGDNTEQMRRVAMMRDVLVTTAKKAQDLAKQVVANPDDMALAAQYHQATTLLGMVSKGVKNAQTDYARALGVMRATPEGDAAALESFVSNMGGLDDVVAHAGKLAQLDLANARNIKRAADLADRSMFSKVKDIWTTTWINGLLSSPVTHAKNILGNELFAAVQVPERFIASLIGKARGAEPEDAVAMGEAVALLRGAIAGQGRAIGAAADTFRTGHSATEGSKLADTGAIQSGDFGKHLGLGGTLGRAADVWGNFVTLPGRGLMTVDEYQKVQAHSAELYAQATRRSEIARAQAMREGKTAQDADAIAKQTYHDTIDDPPEDIVAAANGFARNVTFNEPLASGTIGKQLQKLSEHNVVAKMFLPFVRTPINIALETLERTPFAPLSKGFREDIAKGGVTRDLALARASFGTSVLGTAGFFAANGRLTGGGPGDKAERDALIRSGWQPYSVVFNKGELSDDLKAFLNERGKLTNVGEKYYFSFQGLEPIGGILAAAANYADFAKHSDNADEVEQVGYGTALALGRYFMDTPYMQGMADFVKAVSGNNGQIDEDAIKRVFTNVSKTIGGYAIGGSPIGAYSGAQATAERYLNPEASETKAQPDERGATRGLTEAWNQYKSRSPFLSDTLPQKTNRWGEPIKYGEGEAYETISPIRVKAGNQKDVDRLWLEYDLPGGQPPDTMSFPENPLYKGLEINLPTEAFNELKHLYATSPFFGGKNVQEKLVEVANSSAFKRMTFLQQQNELKRIDSAAMTAARKILRSESIYAKDIADAFQRKYDVAQDLGARSNAVREAQ